MFNFYKNNFYLEFFRYFPLEMDVPFCIINTK